jgi:hypothetical protein
MLVFVGDGHTNFTGLYELAFGGNTAHNACPSRYHDDGEFVGPVEVK